MEHYTRAHFQEAVDFIRSCTSHEPRVGLILGSGLGSLADAVADAERISYEAIPYFPVSTIEGHSGHLVLGDLEGLPVLVMQGRVHFYEGFTIQEVTFPVRVMRAMGVETLLVTNAAGGIASGFQVGDLMLIKDHLNLVGMTGFNPLRGPNDETLGPRFLPMTRTYDAELRASARRIASEQSIPLHEGVYAYLCGPNFETPAEIRYLRTIGADAVGMSTVPEVTVARHGGMRVIGVSGITNIAIDDVDAQGQPSHEEVLEAGKTIAPRMMALIQGVLRSIT